MFHLHSSKKLPSFPLVLQKYLLLSISLLSILNTISSSPSLIFRYCLTLTAISARRSLSPSSLSCDLPVVGSFFATTRSHKTIISIDEMDKKNKSSKKHIILIHGACHGAWSWYKVTTALRSAGYRVTVPDMAASGRDHRQITEVPSFRDYSQPLFQILQSLPPGEKVILVGHSLGGVNIALAMEEFPEKISVAVFLAAFMPDSTSAPSHVIDKYAEERALSEWMDTEFRPVHIGNKILTCMFFGPDMLKSKLYQLCSPEDYILAMNLVRVSSLFLEDLRLKEPFSKARYGSVDAVYIVCSEDLAIPRNYQQSMINTTNILLKQVKTIQTDHMAMLSAPQDLTNLLMEIANNYS